MRLPQMKYRDRYTQTVQTRFGGYNHTNTARDGELWEMKNLTGDEAPLLASRRPRRYVRTLTAPGGIAGVSALCWVDGTTFYYDGTAKGSVSSGRKQFVTMGARVLIFPDKKVYHTELDTFESLEAVVSAAQVSFQNGTIYGRDALCNSVTCSKVDFSAYFSAGDAVEIRGCTVHPENNKTPIVREISDDGHTLRFYENVFTLNGTVEEPTAYTETGVITFSRTLPEMDWLVVNENRLWGCQGDTIYASKLGDPKNFNVFDGLDTDSYWVQAGSGGDFTGAFAAGGYPVFFKEDGVFKMYGDRPNNFQLMRSAVTGAAQGSGASFAVAGETVFYLSAMGVMAYTGGVPSAVGEVLGRRFQYAVGGSDGRKYYVSMQDEGGAWHLFVFDTRTGMWHREDETHAIGFARVGHQLYLLCADGTLWELTGGAAEQVEWLAEFADFTADSPNAKGVGRVQIRFTLDAGATAAVEIQYDSSGVWERVGTISGTGKQSVVLPVVPRRADHWRLRIHGTGGVVIHALTRQYYHGSERNTRR